MNQALIVFFKELRDAVRDHRTLLRLALPALLTGPLMLAVISGLIASFEAQAERREVMVAGMDHAPSLINFIERQNYTLKAAPADYEQQLRKSQITEAVLVVPKDFEAQLARGEPVVVEVVSDSANQRSRAGTGQIKGLLYGFNHERAGITLMLRGVSGEMLTPLDIEDRDLASIQARASQITSMLPMFVMMAVLYGALTAALDSTAGERERGSLEPLLMNPVPHGALVLGKWGAVALLGLAVAALTSVGFIPAQWLIKSDSLQAMFQFGWWEALAFWLLQIPMAAGISAVLMAFAIRSKTFKEAQAGSSLVMMAVSLTPLVTIMNPGAEAAWHYWVPGLGQNALMLLVLKGEALRWTQVAPTFVIGAVMTVAGLAYVARSMRGAVAR